MCSMVCDKMYGINEYIFLILILLKFLHSARRQGNKNLNFSKDYNSLYINDNSVYIIICNTIGKIVPWKRYEIWNEIRHKVKSGLPIFWFGTLSIYWFQYHILELSHQVIATIKWTMQIKNISNFTLKTQ